MPKAVEDENSVNTYPSPLYATVDIGSNKIRLSLYTVDAGGHIVPYDIPERTRFVCALAEGMSVDNAMIKKRNLALAENALESIAALLKKYDIAPNNVSAVGTAALRAVEKNKQQKNDDSIGCLRMALSPYPFKIISAKDEAALVAQAALIDPCYRLLSNARLLSGVPESNPANKVCTSVVAAIGGASTEICVITLDKRTHYLETIPQGTLTLHEIQKNGGMAAVATTFHNALSATKPLINNVPFLYVTGGAWRALGRALCATTPAFLAGKELIRTELATAAKQSPSYYLDCGLLKERAPFMPLAAEVLGLIVEHMGAELVVFLNGKIGDALALNLYQQSLRHPHLPSRSHGQSKLLSSSP